MFWYVDWFVREWSQHERFPQEHSPSYERLHDLAYFLFFGESPYESPSALDAPLEP